MGDQKESKKKGALNFQKETLMATKTILFF